MIEHLHQLAVHAYYAGELEVGRRSCERLLSQQLTPERERIVRRNRTWYTRTLGEYVDARFVRFDCTPAHDGWTLFNPTIVATDGGYTAIVRSSNYRIVDGQYVMPPEDQGRIRTENILVRLTGDLAFAGDPCVLEPPEYNRSEYPVEGFEDVRLNNVGGFLSVSGTVRNWAGRDGTCRIATASVLPHCISSARLPDEPFPGRHEKNWMPLVGVPEWIYSCHEGGRVVTVSEVAGRWVRETRGKSPAIARGWRGGSQLVDVGAGQWLALVHEVADDECGRIYEHRFVLFDDDTASIVKWSAPFAFRETRAIEFAAGLAARGDTLVATFGVRDCEAWMVELDVYDVLDMLGDGNG